MIRKAGGLGGSQIVSDPPADESETNRHFIAAQWHAAATAG